MSRRVDKLVAHYRDEKGLPAQIEIPVANDLDVGTAVNRLTNGEVTQDSHVISKNGVPVSDSASVAPGDKLTASPRKTGGGVPSALSK